MDIDGDTVLVANGMSTGAFVFVRTGTMWTEQQELPSDNGNSAVALSRDTAIVQNSTNPVNVFVRSQNTWSLQATLSPPGGPEAGFGTSVAVDGDTAVIATFTTGGGHADVFVRSGTAWSHQASLVGPAQRTYDCRHVAVHRDTALMTIFSPGANVYVRGGTTWSLQQALTASGVQGGAIWTGPLAVFDDRLAHLPASGNPNPTGPANLYVRSAGTWSEETLVPGNYRWLDLSDRFLVLGAAGAAHVHHRALVAGNPCADADSCLSKVCVDGFCCDRDCTGSCAACSVAAGADQNGVCRIAPAGSLGSPACGDLACNGVSLTCSACTTDTECPADRYCSAARACETRKSQGVSCDFVSDCAASECRVCASGFCADGFCCNRACGPAEACSQALKVSGSNGTCGEAKTAVLGSLCSTNSTCTSGNCADDVCCDTACDGLCEACTAEIKGAGDDGECGPIVAGDDPQGECPDDGAATCERNGLCDGAGDCQLYPERADCDAEPCDGPHDPRRSLFECTSGSCVDGVCCDRECSAKEACSASTKTSGGDGTCGEARTAVNGSPCTLTDGSTCTSGNCVDGVCCDAPCDEVCEACTAVLKGEGDDGTCGSVAIGLNPENPNANTDNGLDCAENAACPIPPVCNGEGRCACQPEGFTTCDEDGVTRINVNGTETDCSPYRCDEGSGDCFPDCTSGADCASGARCTSDGECVAASSDAPAGDSGCGCRTLNAPRKNNQKPRSEGLILLAALGAGLLRRRTFRHKLRQI